MLFARLRYFQPFKAFNLHLYSFFFFFFYFIVFFKFFFFRTPVGHTGTPVLDFGRLLWISKQVQTALFTLRFTSGATPADLLAFSMAADPVPHITDCCQT